MPGASLNAFAEKWPSLLLFDADDGSSTTTTTTIVVALGAILLTVLLALKRKNSDASSTLPPLCSVPVTEFFRSFFGPDGPQYVLEMSRNMGELVFRLPKAPLFGPPLYIVNDYRVARKALEDPASRKFSPANQFFRNTTHNGPNMITEEGHRWKHVRKSISTAFSPLNVKRMVESIDDVVDKWNEETLEPSMKNGQDMDVLNEMNIITSDVIAKVAFDFEFSKTERDTILENLNTCWIEFGQKAGMNPFRQFRLTRWAFPGIRKAQSAAKRLYDLCQKMLDVYRAKAPDKKQPHKIIDLIVNDDEYRDDGERIRDMIAFVIAGFDTTANTLAFALLELARNPNEQIRLRKALTSANDNDAARNCPELKCIVREILRMYPAAAAGSLRQVFNDIAVPDRSYVVPAGAVVITPYYAIQRNETVFEEADSFIPSRWENKNRPSEAALRSLMTFSAGRRNCLGQALANAELHEVLAKLIREYEFSVVEEGKAQNVILFKPVGTLLSARKVVA